MNGETQKSLNLEGEALSDSENVSENEDNLNSSISDLDLNSEREDDMLAEFIESEVLACDSEEEDTFSRPSKRLCVEVKEHSEAPFADENAGTVSNCKKQPHEADRVGASSSSAQSSAETASASKDPKIPPCIEDGYFSRIPVDIIPRILKFLSSEDLITCSLVCRYLNYAASDESLWRRLYCLRWGLKGPAKLHRKPRSCAWKRLYIEQDKDDMMECVNSAPTEFREYYIQMQAAKRSQTPLPSQVNDEKINLDATVSDRITHWKHSRGLPDEFTAEHVCSGNTCTYSKIGDAFVCENTGQVHVCDDQCREIVLDPSSDLLVCTISGRCFDRWLSPSEEQDLVLNYYFVGWNIRF
eukprot:TRINITY_DN2393_c0_g1_i1.p1 TRINITY_DN2393_c0_g1~~TRINITY_DN2393_c0_g1_i1.p1  ORF type:complete len:356 (+),score=72.33 TRINITY_DN2393_c0_g1_i1:180-1247(+)